MCWTLHWRMNWSAKVRMNREAQWEGLGKTDEDFNFLNYLLEEGRAGDDWVCISPMPRGWHTNTQILVKWMTKFRQWWYLWRVITEKRVAGLPCVGWGREGAYNASQGPGLGSKWKTLGAWQVWLITGSDDFPWRTCLEESDTFSDSARPGRRSQAGVRNVRRASHWDQVRWGYQKREWEACDREWGQGIYIITILLWGKQSHFPASVRILGEIVVFFSFPSSLGAVIIHCNPLKSEPSWSELREEGNTPKGEPRRLPAPRAASPVPEPIKTVSCHPQCYMLLTLLVSVSAGGHGPWASPFTGSPDWANPVPTHWRGPHSPPPAAVAASSLPTVSSWPEFNWSHPSLMSPKGTPWALSSKPDQRPFLNWVADFLPVQTRRGRLEWKQPVLEVGAIAVMTHLQLLLQTGVSFQRLICLKSHLASPRNIPF